MWWLIGTNAISEYRSMTGLIFAPVLMLVFRRMKDTNNFITMVALLSVRRNKVMQRVSFCSLTRGADETHPKYRQATSTPTNLILAKNSHLMEESWSTLLALMGPLALHSASRQTILISDKVLAILVLCHSKSSWFLLLFSWSVVDGTPARLEILYQIKPLLVHIGSEF